MPWPTSFFLVSRVTSYRNPKEFAPLKIERGVSQILVCYSLAPRPLPLLTPVRCKECGNWAL